MSEAKITWLASYAKSGNTWVRLFLSHILLGDTWTMDRAQSLIPHMLSVVAPKRVYRNAELDDRATAREVAAMWLPIQARIRSNGIARLRDTVLLKTHNAFVTLEGHAFSSPENSEKAVYIVRDPRDVALSLSHHVQRDLAETVGLMLKPSAMVIPADDYVPEFWASWALNLRSWTAFDNGPLLVMRYEDLVADPGAQFRRLLAFLDWRDDDAAIDAALEATRFKTLQAAERESGFVEAPDGRQFFRRGVAGGWRDHPDQTPFRRIEEAFAPDMTALGYL